jgi:hypothetical protein
MSSSIGCKFHCFSISGNDFFPFVFQFVGLVVVFSLATGINAVLVGHPFDLVKVRDKIPLVKVMLFVWRERGVCGVQKGGE